MQTIFQRSYLILFKSSSQVFLQLVRDGFLGSRNVCQGGKLKDFLRKMGESSSTQWVLPSPSIMPMPLAACHSYPIIVPISDIFEGLSWNLEGFCVVQVCADSNNVFMQNLPSHHPIPFLGYFGNAWHKPEQTTWDVSWAICSHLLFCAIGSIFKPHTSFPVLLGKPSKAFKIISKIRIMYWIFPVIFDW